MARAIGEAIETEIRHVQIVTTPVLDGRLLELRSRLDLKFDRIDARLIAPAIPADSGG